MIFQNSYDGDREALLRVLTVQGLTLDKFRSIQRDMLIVQGMRQHVAGQDVPMTKPKVEDDPRDAAPPPSAESRKLQEEWLSPLRKKAFIKMLWAPPER